MRADFDAYSAILEKSRCTPWQPPSKFSVYPAPGSRLRTGGSIDCPQLPDPAPRLYDYPLPEFDRAGKQAGKIQAVIVYQTPEIIAGGVISNLGIGGFDFL